MTRTDDFARALAALFSELISNGMIGSIAHTACHLGAIRQINHALRGPAEPNR